jgi:hypothetical protein
MMRKACRADGVAWTSLRIERLFPMLSLLAGLALLQPVGLSAQPATRTAAQPAAQAAAQPAAPGVHVPGGPANSPSCEPIRSRIVASIRAKGITDFSVTVHDASARPGGQRVGDCEGGRKLIWYQRGVGAQAESTAGLPPAAAVARARPAREQPILTECADGTTQYGGSCKKR